MSAPVHASAWEVFSLWTGGRAFEPQLEGERLAACTLKVVPWNEAIRTVCGNRIEVTCPACVVLCETAAGQHERNICADCRDPYEPNDPPGFEHRARARSLLRAWKPLCFDCGFWLRKLEERDAKTVIAEGHHYSIGDPQLPTKPVRFDDSKFYGFGGARWEIQFNDGRRLVTHNLWSQGAIPKRFRARAEWADNAAFIPAAPFAEASP